MENKNGFGVFPVGFRFEPTDTELLIDYLLKKVTGLQLPCDYVVIDCDLYDVKDRWREMFEGSDVRSLYFFTKLKKRSLNGYRIQRFTGGCGTWKETQPEKNISHQEKLIGTKKCFKFEFKSKGSDSNVGRWLMDEYQLDSSLLDETMDEFVVCRIKRGKEIKSKAVVVRTPIAGTPPYSSVGWTNPGEVEDDEPTTHEEEMKGCVIEYEQQMIQSDEQFETNNYGTPTPFFTVGELLS